MNNIPEISISCPAKINLYLRVLGKRPDGFHELLTLFQEIDLCDHLSWYPNGEPFRLHVEGADLGDPQDNLVWRAVHGFCQRAAVSVEGRMVLRKNIPAGGGLGGGSSDAAGSLLLLNRHFGHPLSPQELAVLALELGSDVPFFLEGGCCQGRGRGEVLRPMPVPEVPRQGFLLLPGIHMSTPKVFRHLDVTALPQERGEPEVGENDLLKPALAASDAFQRLWSLLCLAFDDGIIFMSGSGSTLVYLSEQPSLSKRQSDLLRSQSVVWREFSFRCV